MEEFLKRKAKRDIEDPVDRNKQLTVDTTEVRKNKNSLDQIRKSMPELPASRFGV